MTAERKNSGHLLHLTSSFRSIQCDPRAAKAKKAPHTNAKQTHALFCGLPASDLHQQTLLTSVTAAGTGRVGGNLRMRGKNICKAKKDVQCGMCVVRPARWGCVLPWLGRSCAEKIRAPVVIEHIWSAASASNVSPPGHPTPSYFRRLSIGSAQARCDVDLQGAPRFIITV